MDSLFPTGVEEDERCFNENLEGESQDQQQVRDGKIKEIIDGIFGNETIQNILRSKETEEETLTSKSSELFTIPQEILQTPEHNITYREDDTTLIATSSKFNEHKSSQNIFENPVDIEWLEKFTNDCFSDHFFTENNEKETSQFADVFNELHQTKNSPVLSSTPCKTKSKNEDGIKIRPIMEEIIQILKNIPTTGIKSDLFTFNKTQQMVLKQQIQMHVQLLTQTNLLSKNHKNYKHYEDESYSLLSELNQLKDASTADTSMYDVPNLKGALEICERNLSTSKPVSTLPNNLHKKGFLPIGKSLAKLMSNSNVFMYVDILPVSDIVPPSLITIPFTYSEDCLLAMSLHALSGAAIDATNLISKLCLPTKDKKKIKIRMKNAMLKPIDTGGNNPIKEYVKHGIHPNADVSIEFVTDMAKPIHRSYNKLMPYWLEAMQYQRQIKQINYEQMNSEASNTFIPLVAMSSTEFTHDTMSVRYDPVTNVSSISNAANTKSTNTPDLSTSASNMPKDDVSMRTNTFVTSIVINPIVVSKAIDKQPSQRKILPNDQKPLLDDSNNSVDSSRTTETVHDEISNVDSNKNNVLDAVTKQKESEMESELYEATSEDKSEDKNSLLKRKNKPKSSLRIKLFKTSTGHRIKKVDITGTYSDENVTEGAVDSCSANEIEPDPLAEEKDQLLAQNYMKRVEEVFKDQPTQYKHFLELMNRFSCGNESATKLYNQLKNMFKDAPSLLSDFVPFLLPQQALECGVYKEYFMYQLAKKFFRRLEIAYSHNKPHHDKILTTLSDLENVACESDVKRSVLTLLKDESDLQDLLSMFFEGGKVPDSFFVGKPEEVYLDDELKDDSNFYAFETVVIGRKLNQTKDFKQSRDLSIQKNDLLAPSAARLVLQESENHFEHDETNLEEDENSIEEDDIMGSDLEQEEDILSNDEEHEFLDVDECMKEACDTEGAVDLSEIEEDELPIENGFDDDLESSSSESEDSSASDDDEEFQTNDDERTIGEDVLNQELF